MFLKVHERGKERVVAACDMEALGRVFAGGGKRLDLAKHREFYEGKKASEEEVARELEKATSINLVGEKAVGVAVKMGLAEKGDATLIGGVLHLQIYRV